MLMESFFALVRRYRLGLFIALAIFLTWMNLQPSEPLETVDAVTHTARPIETSPSTPTQPFPDIGYSELPEKLERIPLDTNGKDPFAPETPKPLLVKKIPKPIEVPPVAIAPPEPPALNLIYAGRIHTPDGSVIVYATMGDSNFALTPGLNLPNGYVVDVINERSVHLNYPALNRTARLDLPAPSKYETR